MTAMRWWRAYAPASPLHPFGGIGKSICLTGMVPNSPCCWIVMRAFILARHTGFISRKIRARLWEILIWMPPFLPIHFWAMRRYRYQISIHQNQKKNNLVLQKILCSPLFLSRKEVSIMFKPYTTEQGRVYLFLKERFMLEQCLVSPISCSALLLEDQNG